MASIGRRERKRLETRQSLVDSALRLFGERGFDQVTVTDIADDADVDASTFFRHFGSKEAVLFTDMAGFTERIGVILDERPADESVIDAITNGILESRDRPPLNPGLERLRALLTQSSPALEAQKLVYRERLINELAAAIGRRVGIDPDVDPRPYLAATVWGAALDYYRQRAVRIVDDEVAQRDLEGHLAAIVDIVRETWPADPPWR